jgi:YD repeat-containing protein
VLKPYPLEKFPVSDRTNLLVNTFNGNVVIDASDLTMRGTGENLSLDHVYNSRLSGGGALSTGWSLGTGQDVGLTVDGSGNVTMHGETAYCATFTKNSDGSYQQAPGVDADLTQLSGGSYILVFRGSNEKWSFSAAGWLTSQADRNGNANTQNYNSDGTLASITDSQARVTTFSYDTSHRLKTITDPTGTAAASYTYDSSGRLATFTDRDGKSTTLGYDTANNVNTITDAEQGVTTLTYDTSDRVTQVNLPGNAGAVVTTYSYGTNQTTETDPNNHQATYTYDTQGRQTKATDALGHSQSQAWTTHSDVASTTDGLNNGTSYTYNTVNDLIGTQLPTTAKYTVGYTQTGQSHLPTTVTDPQNNVVTRSYDAAGNVTKLHSNGLNVDVQVNTYNQPQGTVATSKDGNGNVTSCGYDSAGNLTTLTPPSPRGATHYTYDSLSRVTSVTDGNGVRIDYGYDKLDRVVSISHNSQTLESSSYDALGNLTLRQDPGVSVSFAWTKTDAGSQLVTSWRDDGTAIQRNDYTYDGVGNLTTFGDADTNNVYTYDAANRLTSLADAFGQTTTFGYDNANHRTSATFPGAGTQTNGYDNSGRQTSLTVKNTGGSSLYTSSWSYTKSGGGDSDLIQSRTINA